MSPSITPPAAVDDADQDNIEHQDNPTPTARSITAHSSTATLCNLEDLHHDEDKPHPATIPENPPEPPSPSSSPPIPNEDRPPPVHPPDVVSIFDPASSGGGGPLKRITTQQRERLEAEAKERAEREAQGLPPNDNILTRLRSSSNATTRMRSSSNATTRLRSFSTASRRPQFMVPLKPADHITPVSEHDHHSLSPTLSTRTLVLRPGEKDGFDLNEKASRDVEHQSEPEHVYPDGGYGWVVLACCVVWAALTMGWGMSWGIFQEFLGKGEFAHVDQSVLSMCGTLSAFFANCTAFFFGRMGDRYGFKLVLYASAVVSFIGMFIASWSKSLWMIMVFYGGVLGIGQGMAMPLFMSLPSQWFYRKRGMASGMAIGGAGLGGGILVQVVRPLLTSMGFNRTLLILSFVVLALEVTATLLIRIRPSSPEAQGGGRGPWIDREVVRKSEFWVLGVSLLVGVSAYGIPFNFIPTWISTYVPQTPESLIALPSTLLGFCVCIGRALVGFVADRLGPLNAYILVFVISGIVQFTLWLTAESFASICVFATVYGMVAPGYVGLLPQIVVQLFGPSNLASNVGILLLWNGPGNFICGPLGGGLFDATGRTSFKWVIIVGGTLQIAGGIIALWARFKTSAKIFSKV